MLLISRRFQAIRKPASCCSVLERSPERSERALPLALFSSPPPPATATWPSAHPCSTGKAKAPPPPPPPPASAPSTTRRAARGCSCTAARKPAATCASNVSRTAAPVPPPNPSCVWGLPLRKPRGRAADGVGESLWRLEREIPAAWLPGCCLA
jgi:hypothetical protein